MSSPGPYRPPIPVHKVEFLREVSLFQSMDEDGLARPARSVHRVSQPAGHVLKENEPD